MGSSTILSLLLAPALLAAGATGAPGEGPDGPGTDGPVLELIAVGDLSGEMVSMRCSGESAAGTGFGHLAARVEEARQAGADLVLLSGGLLGDDPFSRHLAASGAWAVRRLEELLADLRPDAAVPGGGEYGLPGGLSLPILRSLAGGSVPYGARNLECPQTGGETCALLRSQGTRVVPAGGLRVGIIMVVGPDALQEADPRNVDHLKVLDPVTVASEEALRLREAGEADLVLALVHLDHESTSPARTLRFAREVRGVDLVVAGLGRNPDGRARVDEVRLDGGLRVLAGVAPGVSQLTRLRVHTRREGPRTVLAGVDVSFEPTAGASPRAAITHLLAQTASEFCVLATRPLRAGALGEPISAWGLLRYAMEIVRRELGADLTVFTSDTLWADPGERLEGAITAEDLNRMFPPVEIAVMAVRGASLKSFLSSNVHAGDGPAPGGLEVLGASLVGPEDARKVLINGRLLDDGRWYRIATTRYLALGGRGALTSLLTSVRHEKHEEPLFLRELVRRFLERDRPERLGIRRPILPAAEFRDLWDLPRWDLSGAATFAFSQVYLRREPGVTYADPQLNRSSLLGLNGDLAARALLSNRIMLWSNLVQLQYGETSTGGDGLQETRDLVTVESAWSWTWLRNRVRVGQPFVPVPMIRAKLESELTRAPAANHHHLEGTLTVGPQWLFADFASLFMGYGIRKELADPGDPLHQGLEVGYTILRVPLLRARDGTPVFELESRFELFWSDPGTRDILKGIGTTALSVSLLDWLRFTTSVNLFLYRERGQDVALSVDTAAGLSLLAGFSVQDYW